MCVGKHHRVRHTCRMELVRDKNQSYFVQYLVGPENPAMQRCMAASFSGALQQLPRGTASRFAAGSTQVVRRYSLNPRCSGPLLKRWTCLCIFKFCEDFGWSKYVCLAECGHAKLYPLLEDPDQLSKAAVLARRDVRSKRPWE